MEHTVPIRNQGAKGREVAKGLGGRRRNCLKYCKMEEISQIGKDKKKGPADAIEKSGEKTW